MLIVGDIGGTNTRLAAFTEHATAPRLAVEEWFSSPELTALEPIVQDFMTRHGMKARAACFCVAGPVIDGRAQLTNLHWSVDAASLAQALGLQSVSLINDLQAIAIALPELSVDEIVTLNPGASKPGGVMAVMAPGTGLGEAFLVTDGDRRIACASEGGHADFAPVDERQAALLAYMTARFGRVSYERVCAGSGIPNVYAFLRQSGEAPESATLARQLEDQADQTPAIVAAALDPQAPDPLALLAVRMVLDIWAAEAGNLALKTLSTGGLYLAGGLPPRFIEWLTDDRFMTVFSAKGRFASLLKSMPVHVVMVNAALIGAARHGAAMADTVNDNAPKNGTA